MIPWVDDDGGRSKYFKGRAGDCVTRAIAIAMQRDYLEVYEELKAQAQRERPRKGKKRSSVRDGVSKATISRYMVELQWCWLPTMFVGQGCRVHLRASELPQGRLVVSVSRHLVAVIDGTVRDTHDPSRDGMRCVYGLWCSPEDYVKNVHDWWKGATS